MRTITNQEIIDANRKAYEGKTLAVFAPNPVCVYKTVQDDKEYRCAIGVVLTDDELNKIEHESNRVHHLFAHGVVKFEDQQFADKIQRMHDSWVVNIGTSKRYVSTNYYNPETYENQFLTVLESGVVNDDV